MAVQTTNEPQEIAQEELDQMGSGK